MVASAATSLAPWSFVWSDCRSGIVVFVRGILPAAVGELSDRLAASAPGAGVVGVAVKDADVVLTGAGGDVVVAAPKTMAIGGGGGGVL